MLAGYVASRASVKSAAFEVVTGVGKSLPLAGILFFLGGLGLAGIPPTNGFISKMLVFKSGIAATKPFALVCMGLAGLTTLVYTTRAFQRIWWLEPAEGIWTKSFGDRLMAPLLLIVLVMLLGLHPEPLVTLALKTAQWLETPGEYIRAVLGR
jgi:formate hydrogenlyase subunit 3/multisubunit Na+/H+ antiporter MnhD subunit